MGGSKSVEADVVGVDDDDGDANSISKKDKQAEWQTSRSYILARFRFAPRACTLPARRASWPSVGGKCDRTLAAIAVLTG